MVYCYAKCSHNSQIHDCKFYRFPTKEREKIRWMHLIGRNDETPKAGRVCSCHFVDNNKASGPVLLVGSRRAIDKTIRKTGYRKAHLSTKCIVPNCYHFASRNNCKYLLFPKNVPQRKLWMKNLGITQKIKHISDIRICGCHFSNGIPLFLPEMQHKIAANEKKNIIKVNRDHEYSSVSKEVISRPTKNVYYVKEFEPQEIELTQEETFSAVNDNVELCSVLNCNSSELDNIIQYYFIPTVDDNFPKNYQLIQEKRREAWLSSLLFKNPNEDFNTLAVCSEHFRTGQPADDLNYNHVDWVPSIKINKSEIDEIMTDDPLFVWSEYTPFRNDIGQWIFGEIASSITNPYVRSNQIVKQKQHLNTGDEIRGIDTMFKMERNSPIHIEDIKEEDELNIDSPTKQIMLIESDQKNEKLEDNNYLIQVPVDTLSNQVIEEVIEENKVPDNSNSFPPIVCESCSRSFPNYVSYYKHKFNSNCCKNQCEICSESFTQRNIFMIHALNHTQERTFTCEICNDSHILSTLGQMDHMRTHSNDKYYICDTCGKAYLVEEDLRSHLATHITKHYELDEPEKRKTIICEVCGKDILTGRFAAHMRIHKNIKLYKCNYCGVHFRTSSYLKNHQQKHIRKPMECDHCGKVFYWWETFYKHVDSHPSLLPPVQCDICFRWYKHQSVLNYHQEKHRIESIVYECYICKIKYKRLKSIKRHFNIEHPPFRLVANLKDINEKPCLYCNKTFLLDCTLEVHMRNHTTEKLYFCTICNQSFIGTELDENEHKGSHVTVNPFVCEICGKEYLNKGNLLIHMKMHPGGQPPDQDNKTSNLVSKYFNAKKLNTDKMIMLQNTSNSNKEMIKITYPKEDEKIVRTNLFKQSIPKVLNIVPTIKYVNIKTQPKSKNMVIMGKTSNANNKTIQITVSKQMQQINYANEQIVPKNISSAIPKVTFNSNTHIIDDPLKVTNKSTKASDTNSIDMFNTIEANNETVELTENTETTVISPFVDTNKLTKSTGVTKYFKCNICNANFKSLVFLIFHKTKQHNIYYHCNICNIVVKDFVNHRIKHKRCTICKQQFGSESELNFHVIIAH